MTTSARRTPGQVAAREVTAVTTEGEFRAWLDEAAPGAWCEYHRGKTVVTGKLGERCPTAAAAWEAYERGRVHLLQRRNGQDDAPFTWLAQRATAKERLA